MTKCLEQLITREIKKCFSVLQDPIQFAYRGNRNVEDATLVFLQNVYKHLDTPKNYCRILFVDFSSAYNTIQPHLWIYKLHKLDLNPKVTAWIVNFLTARPQYVKLKDRHCFFQIELLRTLVLCCHLYYLQYTQTTVQLSTTLLPVLIYTLKFADDTCIQGLIFEDETNDRETIHRFVK